MGWSCAPRLRSSLSIPANWRFKFPTPRAPCVFRFHSGRWNRLQRYSRVVSSIARQSQLGGMPMSSASSPHFRPIYSWQDDVEDLEDYRWGGYHPIQLGDDLSNRRYHVVHKLGYGRSSTVWLVRDRVENQYVSLKVLTARHSELSREVDIRNRLGCGDRHHPGRPFVLSPLTEFYIDGPNGRHLCLISEVVGPSILEVKNAAEHGMLPIEAAQNITAQLALGLSYVHSCGITHGG